MLFSTPPPPSLSLFLSLSHFSPLYMLVILASKTPPLPLILPLPNNSL